MTDDKMGYQLVTRQDVKRAADLNGKRLGISRFGSSSDFSTKVLLKKIGVDPKDVTILQIGNETQRLVALKSGVLTDLFLTLRSVPRPRSQISTFWPTRVRLTFHTSIRECVEALR